MFGIEERIVTWQGRVVASLAIAAATIGAMYLVRHVRRRLGERANPVVVDLLGSIAVVGIVTIATLLFADVWGQTGTLLEQLGVLQLDERAPKLAVTVVAVIGIHVFGGIVGRLLSDLGGERDVMTEHQREVSYRVSKLFLWAFGGIVVLGVWEVDLTGLFVGAGVLGIVLGLAARETIGSLISGFVLMFSRPFEVGDWIVVGEKEGAVTDITMTSTRILATDGEYVVVPNDSISNRIVTNRTRRGRLRLEVEVGVEYDADVERVRSVARTVSERLAAEDDDVLESPAPDVLVRRFDDSAVTFAVRVWVSDPRPGRVARVRNDLHSRIKAAFEDEGIEIPYPKREIRGPDHGWASAGRRERGEEVSGRARD